MRAEEFLNNGFGEDCVKIHRNHVIELMTNFAKYYHTEQLNLPVVKTELLCKHNLWHKSLTKGKKYKLLFEGNGRYFIKDDDGNVFDYNAKCFEIIAQ